MSAVAHTQPSGRRAPARWSVLATVQCLLGAALLERPDRIGRAVGGGGGGESTPPSGVLRVLGGRLLLQGLAALARPDARVARLSAGVDATHAASMLFVAAGVARYRRAALISAALAVGSAAVLYPREPR